MTTGITDPIPSSTHQHRSGLAKWIRRLAVPIIIGWVLLVAALNLTVPQLEVVGQMQSVSMSPADAPSVIAMKRVGTVFEEFKSDSSAMIVLEGDQPLGADAHAFYDVLVDKLGEDTKHVQHIQDFWGDPLTAAGSQSADGKAALVQLYLAGNQGESLANESVDSVRDIVEHNPPPPGLRAAIAATGPGLVLIYLVLELEIQYKSRGFYNRCKLFLETSNLILTEVLSHMTVRVKAGAFTGGCSFLRCKWPPAPACQ